MSFESCTKETVKTNKELLQGFKWKFVAETTDGKDSFGNYEACDKDNIFSWSADNKFTNDEGLTKCKTTDPQIQSGPYTLSADQKTITITEGNFSLDFKIIELSETTLKLEYTFIGLGIKTYTKL
jgi:hypothetical protein